MVPLPGGLPNNQRLQHAQPIQENDLPGVTASTEIHLRPTAGGIEITWKITRKLRSSAGQWTLPLAENSACRAAHLHPDHQDHPAQRPVKWVKDATSTPLIMRLNYPSNGIITCYKLLGADNPSNSVINDWEGHNMAATAASSEKTPGCMDQGWIPPKWLVKSFGMTHICGSVPKPLTVSNWAASLWVRLPVFVLHDSADRLVHRWLQSLRGKSLGPRMSQDCQCR